MVILGLTGGTGSGKSTVSKILKDLGAKIIDADPIARNVVKKGEKALEEIVEYFGSDILLETGELNRAKLGKIVFADREKLKVLNAITHKYIIEEINKIIDLEKQNKQYKVVVIDAALLVESKLYKQCDKIWVVVADEEKRLERIMERDNISLENARNRISSQMSQQQLIQYATEVIYNNESLESLEEQVLNLWKSIN